ncbi:hypothetical protein TWF481_004522 [Arthrobotrys musiformis]|uniref:Uncharacterized protein n=1 Tax=Arthrobotrys musiformis TaxID=47236 RepID=A0AAV9WJV0_9PEZI
MGGAMYYAVFGVGFLCSVVQGLQLRIPSIRTNSVDNLIIDLESLQSDIEMYATVIPSAEDSYNYVQDVIDAAVAERGGIFGGNSIPSDDLASAAQDVYDTLASYEIPTGQKTEPQGNYLMNDPLLNYDLKSILNYIQDWKPSDESIFPPPDPNLSNPEMLAFFQEARDLERAEEAARVNDIEQSTREFRAMFPKLFPDSQTPDLGDGGVGTSLDDYQDLYLSMLQGGSPDILRHKVGPLGFDYQPGGSTSGAMEEEVVDTTTTTVPVNTASTGQIDYNTGYNAPFNTLSTGQFNTGYGGPFDTVQTTQVDTTFNWPLDTVSIPQVDAVSNTVVDTAYKNFSPFDTISAGGGNTQASTGPARTSTGSIGQDAPARGLPVAGSPWSSFDSNSPPPVQEFRTRPDRHAIRRNRKANLANGVNPDYDPTNNNPQGRRIRTLKKGDGAQPQQQSGSPRDDVNSNSKRRLQLNFKA